MIRATAFIAITLSIAAPAVAEVTPDAVAWDEHGAVAESLSGGAGNPEEGARIFGERSLGNCVACHVNSDSKADFQGDVGPSLDGAAGRWTQAQLRGIVADAKRTFPGSMMPSMYKTHGYVRPGVAFTAKPAAEPLPPLLNAQQIEDVVAYLMTLKE